jgi:hypothetical protein
MSPGYSLTHFALKVKNFPFTIVETQIQCIEKFPSEFVLSLSLLPKPTLGMPWKKGVKGAHLCFPDVACSVIRRQNVGW